MKCFICNQDETLPGLTSVLLERGHLTLTINNVPVRICSYCGEAYADETVTAILLSQAGKMAHTGTKVAAREYALS